MYSTEYKKTQSNTIPTVVNINKLINVNLHERTTRPPDPKVNQGASPPRAVLGK